MEPPGSSLATVETDVTTQTETLPIERNVLIACLREEQWTALATAMLDLWWAEQERKYDARHAEIVRRSEHQKANHAANLAFLQAEERRLKEGRTVSIDGSDGEMPLVVRLKKQRTGLRFVEEKHGDFVAWATNGKTGERALVSVELHGVKLTLDQFERLKVLMPEVAEGCKVDFVPRKADCTKWVERTGETPPGFERCGGEDDYEVVVTKDGVVAGYTPTAQVEDGK